jgi:hypothetical protein
VLAVALEPSVFARDRPGSGERADNVKRSYLFSRSGRPYGLPFEFVPSGGGGGRKLSLPPRWCIYPRLCSGA